MSRSLLSLPALLIVSACAVAPEVAPSEMAPDLAEHIPGEWFEEDDLRYVEPEVVDETGDDDDAPNDDDDDHVPNDDDAPEPWDAAPPDWVQDGSILELDMTCALLDGPHHKTYKKQGDRWIPIASVGNGLLPAFLPCVGESRKRFLTWDGSPSLYVFAGSMHHDLTPLAQPHKWMGEVYPDDPQSTHACIEALDAHGLEWPLAIQVTFTDVIP
jgi:hypothetical protein